MLQFGQRLIGKVGFYLMQVILKVDLPQVW